MQRRHNILMIVGIILLGRGAQIIFSIIINPTAPYHAGIPQGSWSSHTVSLGYNQLKEESIRDQKPSPIHNTILTRYNTQCLYGPGRCQAFAFQNLIGSIQWVQAIQYIGKNVDITQPSNVTNMINTTNETSPLRPYPYIFAEILGPSYRKEADLTGNIITRDNTILLGERGISYTCNSDKLKKMKDLTYEEFLIALERKDPDLRAPCQDYRLPHSLAFNYFQYSGDSEKAAYYYMVAAFHDDVPNITVSMPAIVRGREGKNLVSATIWYDRFQNAINQYDKIKNKNSDESKEVESTMDNAIKKSVSEFSLYILQETYPQGLMTGEYLSTTKVSQTIRHIIHTCTTTPTVACDILGHGLQYGWIQDNGLLTYPIDNTLVYKRRTDKSIWRIGKKNNYLYIKK